MNKILMLCNNFSSTGGTGILRTLKFCKYLPKNNWEPIIIHIKNRNIVKFLSQKHEIIFGTKRYSSLHSRFIENIGLFLDRYLGNSRYCLLPDIYIFSIIPTILKAIRVNRVEQIDLLYCSCSPYSLAIAGVFIKKIIHKPLIIDLRDAWTINPYESYPSKFHRHIDEALENFVFDNCDKIIIVTDALRKQYISKYNGSISNKICTITNGFDFEDLQQVRPPSNKFIITFTGNFYKMRSPELFMKGFYRFSQHYSHLDIEVHFYGYSGGLTEELIKKFDLEKYIFAHSRISHEDVYKEIAKSHLLLYIEPTSAVPTKLFEYISSGRPILAITPEGAAANLIRDNSPFSMIVEENEDKIASSLENYYLKWTNNSYPLQSASKKFLRDYNRENLTFHLATVLNEIQAFTYRNNI